MKFTRWACVDRANEYKYLFLAGSQSVNIVQKLGVISCCWRYSGKKKSIYFKIIKILKMDVLSKTIWSPPTQNDFSTNNSKLMNILFCLISFF